MLKLMGDSEAAKGHAGYRHKLNREEVRSLADALCHFYDVPVLDKIVLKTQLTMYRAGWINGYKRYMILYPLGMSAGVVIHELAHYLMYHKDRPHHLRGERGNPHHSPLFKFWQNRLLWCYDKFLSL